MTKVLNNLHVLCKGATLLLESTHLDKKKSDFFLMETLHCTFGHKATGLDIAVVFFFVCFVLLYAIFTREVHNS